MNRDTLRILKKIRDDFDVAVAEGKTHTEFPYDGHIESYRIALELIMVPCDVYRINVYWICSRHECYTKIDGVFVGRDRLIVVPKNTPMNELKRSVNCGRSIFSLFGKSRID